MPCSAGSQGMLELKEMQTVSSLNKSETDINISLGRVE